MYLTTEDLDDRMQELYAITREGGTLTRDEHNELTKLEDLSREITDWGYNATLIPVDEFVNYAKQLAEELYNNIEDSDWPYNCIDWKEAADLLAEDYSEITYKGKAYYVRD